MFIYCGNNPLIYCDQQGDCFHRLDFWNDCDECGGYTLKQKWNNYYENSLTATFTIGVYASATIGTFDVTGSFDFAFDLKGNIQLFTSGSFDVTSSGSLSGSVGVTASTFVMPDTSYLAGGTYYTGGSVSFLNPSGVGSVSMGGNVGQTSDGYWGVNGSLGIGTSRIPGVEFHGGYTRTKAVTQKFNLIEQLMSFSF